MGKLTQAQVERVQQYARARAAADELRDRDRKRLQAEMLGMVRAREAREAPARAASPTGRRGRDPAYAAASEAWRRSSTRCCSTSTAC